MKPIQRVYRFKKLSTLKHSCILIVSALKRSCFYAETLLHSIYTYIYLYLIPVVSQQQIVNNFIGENFL